MPRCLGSEACFKSHASSILCQDITFWHYILVLQDITFWHVIIGTMSEVNLVFVACRNSDTGRFKTVLVRAGKTRQDCRAEALPC